MNTSTRLARFQSEINPLRINFKEARQKLQGGSVAMGNFDGVHRGHQTLFQELQGGARGVLTFHPHPYYFFNQSKEGYASRYLLNDRATQAELLKRQGITWIVDIPFDSTLTAMQPEHFIQQYLAPLNLRKLVVGEDFRFGENRKGSAHTLVEALSPGTEVVIKPMFTQGLTQELTQELTQGLIPGLIQGLTQAIPQAIPEGTVISSTRLRDLIRKGDLSGFHEGAGYPLQWLCGRVAGDGFGRTIGVPTFNLTVSEQQLLVPDGIYVASLAPRHMQQQPAILYVGKRPSLGQGEMRLEAHVLEQDVNWEHDALTVKLYFRLREDRKFSTIEELVKAMKEDIQTASRWWQTRAPPM